MKVARLILLLFLISTDSVEALANEILFESDVQLKTDENQSFKEIKSGSTVKINSGQSALVIIPNALPLMLFSPMSSDSKLTISSANMNAILQEQIRAPLQLAIREIIQELRKAESLIRKKDLTQASTVVNGLKQKYKNISPVLFMSGTINYLLNNKTAAIEDLEKGLALDPDDGPAKKLLTELKGAP